MRIRFGSKVIEKEFLGQDRHGTVFQPVLIGKRSIVKAFKPFAFNLTIVEPPIGPPRGRKSITRS